MVSVTEEKKKTYKPSLGAKPARSSTSMSGFVTNMLKVLKQTAVKSQPTFEDTVIVLEIVRTVVFFTAGGFLLTIYHNKYPNVRSKYVLF